MWKHCLIFFNFFQVTLILASLLRHATLLRSPRDRRKSQPQVLAPLRRCRAKSVQVLKQPVLHLVFVQFTATCLSVSAEYLHIAGFRF